MEPLTEGRVRVRVNHMADIKLAQLIVKIAVKVDAPVGRKSAA